MVRINSISSVNNYVFAQNKISFKGTDNQTNPQIKQLEDVKPDFAVKTPISYSKIGEMEFPYDTKAHCYKLANGQKVIIVPQEGETVVRTYVNTGSMNEPDNIRGISHYIEHNLFNGSEGLEEGDFFNQVNKMGASTNASTGFAETNYYISSNLLNDTDLETKIKLHSSMLESPLFAVEKLEKEKEIVNSEINMITSNPQNIAINKMLKNLYGIKTTSTDMIGGTTDNITNLKREDVVNYYNNNYYPANMVTVITGEVDPEQTIAIISKNFTSKRTPAKQRHFEELKPTDKAVREDIISDKATASFITVGFNGPKSNDTKDRIYSEALFALLTSTPSARLTKALKPLNSEAECEDEKISSNPNDGRAIIFAAESTEENSEKVLKTMFTEIGNISNNPPTEQEMKIVKKVLLKGFSNVLENSFATNDAIGTSILENNQDYLNNYEKIVNEMTPEDLVNTAKKYFDVNKASVAVVHPSSATEESIKTNYKNVSFTGAKKDAINLDSVKEYNMPNNYRLYTVNNKTDNVEMLFRIDVNEYSKARPSAVLILNEILNEGSMSRNQETMNTDLAQDGIMLGMSASDRSISSAMGCDTETIEKTLQSLKEVIENPRFTQEEFDHAKSLIKDIIETREKSAYDKLDEEFYKGLPKGYTKEEILKDLETVTLDDVKNVYSELIKNGKGMISVAGPFDRKPELRQTIFNNLGTFTPVKEFSQEELQNIYRPTEQVKVLTDTDFKNQAEIIEAFRFPITKNIKDTASLKLLNIILGGNPSSRLFTDLRENEKLAYNVKSNYTSTDDMGVITLRIGTTTENKETGETSFDNVQKSIDGFNRHIEKIKTEKVTDEELNNAKLTLKNAVLNSMHSADGKNNNLMQTGDSAYGIQKANLYFKEINNITADDIYNTANYVFSGKPVYSIVATENTLKANEEYLNKLKG